jgi:hypothetical protein
MWVTGGLDQGSLRVKEGSRGDWIKARLGLRRGNAGLPSSILSTRRDKLPPSVQLLPAVRLLTTESLSMLPTVCHPPRNAVHRLPPLMQHCLPPAARHCLLSITNRATLTTVSHAVLSTICHPPNVMLPTVCHASRNTVCRPRHNTLCRLPYTGSTGLQLLSVERHHLLAAALAVAAAALLAAAAAVALLATAARVLLVAEAGVSHCVQANELLQTSCYNQVAVAMQRSVPVPKSSQ